MRRRPRVRVEALQSGGGQERGIRSGTVPTPLAVGMGEACYIVKKEMAYDHEHITALGKRLLDKICGQLTHVIRNGDPNQTYPGCINLSFAYVEGKIWMYQKMNNDTYTFLRGVSPNGLERYSTF